MALNSSPMASRPHLPLLLAPCGIHPSNLSARCVLTRKTITLPATASWSFSGVGSSMSAASTSGHVLLMTPAGDTDQYCFMWINPLTGYSQQILPRLSEYGMMRHGHTSFRVCEDGTVLVCRFYSEGPSRRRILRVSVLLRNSPTWLDTQIIWPEQHVPSSRVRQMYYSAMEDGSIVCGDVSSGCFAVVSPYFGTSNWIGPPPVEHGKAVGRTFILEWRGDVFYAQIMTAPFGTRRQPLSVSLHKLQHKDGRASCVPETVNPDRIMFLSGNSSFLIETTRVPGARSCCYGGYAYFLFDDSSKKDVTRVYQYDLRRDDLAVIDELPTH